MLIIEIAGAILAIVFGLSFIGLLVVAYYDWKADNDCGRRCAEGVLKIKSKETK